METLNFRSSPEFRRWLSENHAASNGIWLRLFKKTSRQKSLTYAEALDQALCFGWIDGQKKSHDELSWIQKFTPRRVKSGWSRINTKHAERLISTGAMAPEGLRAVEAAKSDGRWRSAYDSPRNARPPDDFLKALAKNLKAKAFFATLNRTNIYSIVYRLQTAKRPETRERRLRQIVEMLERGEKFH